MRFSDDIWALGILFLELIIGIIMNKIFSKKVMGTFEVNLMLELV